MMGSWGSIVPTAQLAAYSALSIPLAMAALPIYVHVPKLYATFGLSLTWIGFALLVLRAADALLDPLLGRWSDRVRSRKHFMAYALLPLALGIGLTFAPGWFAASSAAGLLVGLSLTYVGYSALTIAYHAWGAQWTADLHERTRITTWREAMGLLGVLLAAATPVVLTQQRGVHTGYALYAVVVVVTLVACAGITLRFASAPASGQTIAPLYIGQVWRDGRFQRLLWAFALNGIAAAIPATLFLFFVEDVIKAHSWQAPFLVAYFLAGAAAAPAWLWASRQYGKRATWGASMLLAIATFVWAALLGPGDRIAFLAICILSGIALGADLTLPPSMLADVIAANTASESSGAYFGIWTMVNKLNLALAAGLSLPLLAWWGYTPNTPTANLAALTIAYCLLPCALKCLAVLALYFVEDESNVEKRV